MPGEVSAVLIDLDGVLYVEEEPIDGAVEAVKRLRAQGLAMRFVTNTTAHSRDRTIAKLGRLGFSVAERELVTPAALALRYCRQRGHQRVALVMNEEVKRDFAALEESGEHPQAVIIGDLGPAFGYDVLNHAFRCVMDGAELIALQKNRYWLRADGLSLDVGPFVAASSTRPAPRHTWSASHRVVFSSRFSRISDWTRPQQRWSATTSNLTSRGRCARGFGRSSCERASTARSMCASWGSTQLP